MVSNTESSMSGRGTKIVVLCLLALALTAGSASAKDLVERLSIGYNYQLGVNLLSDRLDGAFLSNQSLSAKYWFTNRIGAEALAGFTYAKEEDDKGVGGSFGAKFLYNVILEPNMNVYVGAGAGVLPVSIKVDDDTDNNVGFMAQGFGGVEFFLDGLPNLGFDVEVGLEYVDFDRFQEFGTYGGGFGLIGIRCYF
jgi:hypothetical protein